MVPLTLLAAVVVVLSTTLVALSARDRRHGQRTASSGAIADRVRDARRAVRESEDRWHQSQIVGRAARSGRPELRRSVRYPWLG